MLSKNQIKKIKKFSLDYYKRLDSTHSINHAIRTVKLARYIAKREKADLQICELGAFLHQIHNPDKVDRFLKKINLDKNVRKYLVHIVYANNLKNIHKAKTKEAKVVFDADKLQVIGPFGIGREIAWRRQLIKGDFRKVMSSVKKIEKICFKLLQTKTGKKLAKTQQNLSDKFFREFERWNKLTMVK